MSQKDFDRFAYFVCKAQNFAIAFKPDRKNKVNDEVVLTPGIRIEFNNKMYRIEKNDENMAIIQFLRDKIDAEKDMDPRMRTMWEEQPPVRMMAEDKVLKILAKEDEEHENEKLKLQSEIARLSAENEKLLKKVK